MSMNTATKGFKITMGGIASFVAVVIAIQPYMNLKAAQENLQNEVRAIKVKTDLDHDLIIKMSSDVSWMRLRLENNNGNNRNGQ